MAVADEAIEKIKAMITSGALRAGDRLPREADLAARGGQVLVDGAHRRRRAVAGLGVMSRRGQAGMACVP